MKTTDRNLPTKNPSSIKTRLARHFLQSMKKLMTNKRYNNISDKHKRCHVIRAAAYASMASSVGPNRLWSRALLGKIRTRKMHHGQIISKERKITSSNIHHARKLTMRSRNPRNDDDILRELVPGGESMDICRLLNETGDYIKCLRAQVQLMRKIVDYSSSRF